MESPIQSELSTYCGLSQLADSFEETYGVVERRIVENVAWSLLKMNKLEEEILRIETLHEQDESVSEPSHLKLVPVSSFCPFTLISLLMLLMLFVNNLVFSALISML